MIIILTQYLIYGILGIGIYNRIYDNNTLDFFDFNFALLVLATVIIAAAGNVINDIYDYEIDLINKPQKIFINEIISIKKAWLLYSLMNGIALIIGVYLGYNSVNYGNYYLIGFPLIISLLWSYSAFFKKMPLIGNLIIAFFCALVPIYALLPTFNSTYFHNGNSTYSLLRDVGLLYILFAFLTTLIREIVKDIEDMEGDLLGNARTFPIVSGIRISKIVLIVLLFCSLPLWLVPFSNIKVTNSHSLTFWISNIYLIIIIGLPFLRIGYLIIKAQTKSDFHQISSQIKWLMLAGLLFLIVFYLEFQWYSNFL